jgi:hypothetical protein
MACPLRRRPTMSQRAVERAIGKLITDEEFREAFYRKPDTALFASGLELTPAELAALFRIPRDVVRRFSTRLDDRICRIHVPVPTEETES